MCVCEHNVCLPTGILGLAQFETCSGDSILQMGCSGVEKLSFTAGQSVEFNIALSHQGAIDNCFNQSIRRVSLFKNEISIVECSNTSCTTSLDPRVKVTRSMGRFDIAIMLRDLSTSNSGTYVANADIRRPSNLMQVCIFKNFSLNVVDPTGTPISHTT